MSLEVIEFKAEHLDLIALQESQQYLRAHMEPGMGVYLESLQAFTGIADGVVVACAGVLPYWEGRGLAWAYLGETAGRHMASVHRAVKRYLEVAPFNRIEAAVDVEFEEGHRWIQMLGFKLEAQHMAKFRPDGGAASLYARVK